MHRSKKIDQNKQLDGNGVKVKWSFTQEHVGNKT